MRATPSPAPLLACVLALAVLCAVAGPSNAQIQFRDDAAALGVQFTWNGSWSNGDFGAGAAVEDLEGDGDLDLFLGTKKSQPLRVYRNDGATFTDVSAILDVASAYDKKQILFADLDDDGRRDLVLSLWDPFGIGFQGGRLMILRNDGDGSFTDVSSAPVDSAMAGLPTGIAAGDVDRDGDLDLYVSVWKAGPPDASSRNRLLRNEGGFVFTDVATALGVDDAKKSYQPVLTDLSGDGWLDIVVAEDKQGGLTYYENDGAGGFVDRTMASGLDGSIVPPGTTESQLIDGMGIAVGDHDNDGDLDLYVTNIFDGNVLYENRGDGSFVDVAPSTGTVNYRMGWGCGFLDLDHDGWLDLYVVDFGNGVVSGFSKLDRVYHHGGSLPVRYTDLGLAAGITQPDDGFSMAAGDLDGDGDLDVVVTNGDAPVRVYRNLDDGARHWAHFELRGVQSNRDGVGARVHVRAGGRTWVREQRAGTGYLGFDSHALEFGLGGATAIDEVRVEWPSGQSDTWTDLPVDTRIRLTEGGTPTVANAPLPTVRGGFGDRGFGLRWEARASDGWERFDVERTRGGSERTLARLAVVSGQEEYAFVDPEVRDGDLYRIRGLRAGTSIEVARVVARVPAMFRVEVAPASPNPFNPRTRLRFAAPAGVPVHLRIVDAQGRQVRTLAAPEGAGWRETIWDGRDDAGRPVASGAYRFVAEAEGIARSTPLTLVR